MSTATAMELGFLPGRFYRQARNPCVNLLLTYAEGCFANCAYCGLARKRPGSYTEKSFIKVEWPARPVEEILVRVHEKESRLSRICISMVTNPRAVRDTLDLSRHFSEGCRVPLSVLCAPTVLSEDDLYALRQAGVDMLGVAVDAAREDLFRDVRGAGVQGPHRWDRYWDTVRRGVSVFGRGKVSVHLIVGLGESERDMVGAFQRVHDEGALIHLFSFFAESGSRLSHLPQPPWSSYLRLQVARYAIEQERCRAENFAFDKQGGIRYFGMQEDALQEVVDRREAFLTSGCPGEDGTLACNRPFGNCFPGPKQWNYPYLPNDEEMALIRAELFGSHWTVRYPATRERLCP